MGLLVAEARKLWTVRTTWVLTLAGLGLVALTTALLLFSELVFGPFTGDSAAVAAAVDQIGASAPLVLVVAVLAMTTEFRHGTIGRTLQLTPSRSAVLVSKLAVGVVYAVAFFAIAAVLVAGLILLTTVVDGVSLEIGSEVGRSAWQGLVGLILNALFGVAVGALIRSQVVAITLLLVWMFVGESLFVAFLPDVGRWLPFQALNSLFVSGAEVTVEGGMGMVSPLDPMVALAAFLGYVLVAIVTSGVLLRVRDV